MPLPSDLQSFLDQYDAAERDLHSLLDGLPESLTAWRAAPHTWSIAQCIEHLGITNRTYLDAMKIPISTARNRGKLRRGTVHSGPFGGLFARTIEPPVRRARIKAPKNIVPYPQSSLPDALSAFQSAQNDLRKFVHANADLDLTHIHFPNPFMNGVRFGIGSALRIMAAHERRHLWQAWNIRRQAEQSAQSSAANL